MSSPMKLHTTNKNKLTNNKLTNNKTKKQNSKIEYLKVSYPDTLLETIKNNQDITNIPTIYSKPPKITIQNAKSKLYLITMTDPDAPYGLQNIMNKSTQANKTPNKKPNHTYTHWVYLQDMRKQNTTNTSTSNTSNTPIQTLVPYAPPTPPAGIHRYQFNIYDITTISKTILDTLINKINNTNTPDRNKYYRNKLKNLKTYKLKTLFQYKVNSNK